MTPENAASAVARPAGLTPENAKVLARYARRLGRSPLSGHSPRTYLDAIRAYLTWLQDAPVGGDPLNDAAAKDWAVRDYRSYLVTVAKRATATVNKHLAALQDFYAWRGLGPPQGVRRHQVPRHAPKALDPPRAPEAARGAGRLARRAPLTARRGPGRLVHLRWGHQDDYRRLPQLAHVAHQRQSQPAPPDFTLCRKLSLRATRFHGE
jgi:hypothetical protein